MKAILGKVFISYSRQDSEIPEGIDLVLTRKQKIIFADVPFETGLQQLLDALGKNGAAISAPPIEHPAPQPAQRESASTAPWSLGIVSAEVFEVGANAFHLKIACLLLTTLIGRPNMHPDPVQ